LDGIEPAWTMLDYGSYNALHEEPSAGNQAIRVDLNLTETDLAGSTVARTALVLLRRAADEDGLKLTATGNLSRAVVAEMIEVSEWPEGFLFELSFRAETPMGRCYSSTTPCLTKSSYCSSSTHDST
jgi:hypothetical protein